MENLKEPVGKALNGRAELLPLWFSTMLHHSLVSTATNDYQDFGAIGVASLQMVAEANGIAPRDAMMVAAHGWDIAGIKAAGMQAVFVARPGKTLYPLAQKPDYIVQDLHELVALLLENNQR